MSLSSLFSKLTASVSVPAIEHDDLTRAWLDGSCTIVDVREPQEYAAGHIPGAVNYPLSRFEPRRLPDDKPVVLVCQSGARSAKALQRALAAGRQNIRHYPPGTAGWKTRGGDLARPKNHPNEL